MCHQRWFGGGGGGGREEEEDGSGLGCGGRRGGGTVLLWVEALFDGVAMEVCAQREGRKKRALEKLGFRVLHFFYLFFFLN